MNKTLISFLCICTWLPLAAQTTLDEYRRAVADYSWQIKIAASASDEAAERMGQARTGYLPRLSLDGSFSVAFRHNEGEKQWTFGVLPQIVQTLYGGGAVRAAYRHAQLGYDIALCEEEFTRFDVRYAADYAYWNLSSFRVFAAAMREYVGIIRSLKEVVDRRFTEGYIAKGDVLMIEARLSDAEYELVKTEQNLSVALHNFNILRGMPVETEVKLAQTIRDTVPMPSRMPLDVTLQNRPDFAAASLRTDQAETGVRMARAPYNPQVSIGVGGSWEPYTPNRTGETTLDGSAFVRVSVPIFHWGERRRAVGAARAVQMRSEWSAAQLRDDIVREETNGWTAVVNSYAQVASTEENLRIASENLEISTYSYGEGLATILDVLQAQLSWIQLYSNSIQAHYNYAEAVSAYWRITAR